MKEIHATEQNLVRWANKLPIEQIKLNHLKMSIEEIQSCDLVTITIGDQQRVLKDRFMGFREIE